MLKLSRRLSNEATRLWQNKEKCESEGDTSSFDERSGDIRVVLAKSGKQVCINEVHIVETLTLIITMFHNNL